MADIFIIKSGNLDGPHSPDEINELLLSKDINLNQLAWMEGMEDWYKLNDKQFTRIGVGTFDKISSNGACKKKNKVCSHPAILKENNKIEIDETNIYGKSLKKGIGCYKIFGVVFICCCISTIPIFGWIFVIFLIVVFVSKAIKKSV